MDELRSVTFRSAIKRKSPLNFFLSPNKKIKRIRKLN